MSFCSNCGSSVEGNFCNECGTPVGSPIQEINPIQQPIQQPMQQPMQQPQYQQPMQQPMQQPQYQPPNIVINNVNTNTNTNENNNAGAGYGATIVSKSKMLALILCIFLGILGAHRFYVGKFGTGLIWLFTGGFFGIGWILDIISILVGGFKDKLGVPLR